MAVLGATGSIGTATIDVLNHLQKVDPETNWNLWAASGHRNVDELYRIAQSTATKNETGCRVIFSDETCDRNALETRFSSLGCDVRFGASALVEAASEEEVDVVVASIVGRAGLESTLAAVDCGKRVALANKETLVVAGGLVRQRMSDSGARLLPVDSEHSAIWQCMEGSPCNVRKLILTASGGPFRQATRQEMESATPDDALAHPTWEMGRKISIDSATMMNKALEVIEARWLFDVPADKIEVLVHPQSIIHSLVEFEDGSILAQLSPPDMKLPIQYALTHPRRLPCPTPPLDCTRPWDLQLLPVDLERFPALSLGFEVARVGGTAGSVVNAANEVAVGLFLNGQIRFTDIVPLCQKILANHEYDAEPDLSELLKRDAWARTETEKCAGNVQ
ncbi:MAG: 1-deoxy-D-xylulose-5-phosphate reductoisomerase [Planctomycetota bacterium]